MSDTHTHRQLPWKPVAGLLLAGLAGWLLAWIVLPPSSGTQENPSARPPVDAGKSSSLIQAPDNAKAPAANSLEELLRQQARQSQEAAIAMGQLPSRLREAASGTKPAETAATKSAKDLQLERAQARSRAILDIQAKAIAEIQAVPPGDLKRLMAAISKFDAQMQAAGAPSIVDMDKLRKTLESADRMQQLNKELIAEAGKGRAADINRVRVLSQEIQSLQKNLAQPIIKADALQKVMTP